MVFCAPRIEQSSDITTFVLLQISAVRFLNIMHQPLTTTQNNLHRDTLGGEAHKLGDVSRVTRSKTIRSSNKMFLWETETLRWDRREERPHASDFSPSLWNNWKEITDFAGHENILHAFKVLVDLSQNTLTSPSISNLLQHQKILNFSKIQLVVLYEKCEPSITQTCLICNCEDFPAQDYFCRYYGLQLIWKRRHT